jgi:transposase-like protein
MSQNVQQQFEPDARRNRYFSEEFKRARVEELSTRKVRVGEVCQVYGVSRASVYRWIYEYSGAKRGTKTVVQMESEASKVLYYQSQIAEMERLFGQKQMELDYLNKVLELASAELGYDLKKKHGPTRWNGSGPTSAPTPTK